MALTSMPYLTIQELDANGDPYSGAKLFFYAAGTTTKQNTYADANGNTANANPVILDSAGRATVFFQPLTYDVVLAPSTDTDPPTSPIWTRPGIAAVPVSSGNLDISGTAGESLTAGAAVALSDGTGGKTAGKWYKADADFTYLSSLAPEVGMVQDAIASGASGSIRKGGRITGLSGLTEGTLYYASATAGDLTATPPTNARPIATADSTTSVIVDPGIPFASATLPGLLSLAAQTLVGIKTLNAPVFSGLPTGIGAFVTSYAAADTTKNNNNTLIDVTGLSFAVAANATYVFTFVIHGITAVAAGLKFGITGPSAPTAIRWGFKFDAGSASFSSFTNSNYNTSTATAQTGMLIGQLRNGANAGTVQFQFSQLNADASNSTIYAESNVMAWRVA